MAESRKPLTETAGESKAPEIKPVDINPTDPNLPEEQRKLLDQFLLVEEAKHGQKGIFKRKVWEKGEVYTLADGQAIRLPDHEIHRTPKRYAAVVVLGPDETLPSVEERRKEKENLGAGVIYLQQDSDGHIRACTTNDTEMKSLTENQKKQLQPLINFNAPVRLIDTNKDKHNTIFAIHAICDYPKYIYRINRVGIGPDKSGNQGEVYFSSGKLEFSNGKSSYIDDKTSRKPHDTRPPKKEKITKKISHLSSVQFAMAELGLLTQNPALKKRLHTKLGTLQKNAEGEIESISITQRRAPGESLFDIMNSCGLDLSTVLSDQERHHLIKLLLKAVCDDHAANISHRDIKPENIIVHIVNGVVKEVNLIDYGLARDKTKTRAFSGTPGYIAPEIAAGQFSDQRCDDYSLGLVLRSIVGDEMAQKRLVVISSETLTKQHDLVLYAAAQYYLNISMQNMDFSELYSKEYTDLITQLLTGMTKPLPDERTSSENALSLIEAFEQGKTEEIEQSEEKHDSIATRITPESYARLDEQYATGIDKINSIQNREIKKLLFEEACHELEKYRSSLDNSLVNVDENSDYYLRACDSIDFINACQNKINAIYRSTTHPFPYEKMGEAIDHICKIVLEEKILIEKNNFLENKMTTMTREEKLNLLSGTLGFESEQTQEQDDETALQAYQGFLQSGSGLFTPTSSEESEPIVKMHVENANEPSKSPPSPTRHK